MFGSFKLGTIRGIGVHIHWTFWLIPMLYGFAALASGGWIAGLSTLAIVLGIFACVLAHEFGHAFAAEAFGIPTRDITLFPFGGVARLARIPQRPIEELLIALAGPAVNVFIAIGILALAPLFSLPSLGESPYGAAAASLLDNLLIGNIVLVVFNMLPAFPMDGGRVLRSLLAMRTSHLRATEIAARVGRWMALAFLVAAIPFGRFELLLVAFVVFTAGTAELMEARRRSLGGSQGIWFQWSSVSHATPNGPTEFWSRSSQSSVTHPVDQVIDAIEVREIKPLP